MKTYKQKYEELGSDFYKVSKELMDANLNIFQLKSIIRESNLADSMVFKDVMLKFEKTVSALEAIQAIEKADRLKGIDPSCKTTIEMIAEEALLQVREYA